MNRKTRIWLLKAGALMLAGCILFAGVMASPKWEPKKLSADQFETNTHEIGGEFRDISVKTDTADIQFLPSEDGTCRVVCYEEHDALHTVNVEGSTLTIAPAEQRAWHTYASFGTPKITVYLPQADYDTLLIHSGTGTAEISGDLTFESAQLFLSTGNANFYASASGAVQIETSTGNIRVEHTSAGALALSTATGLVSVTDVTCAENVGVDVATGDAVLTGVSCKNVRSKGSAGSLTLTHVLASEEITVERSTGDVTLTACDAAGLSVQTDTGDVTGSLLTDKVFLTDTAAGTVDVPNSTTGGPCEIRTATGDIQFRIGESAG